MNNAGVCVRSMNKKGLMGAERPIKPIELWEIYLLSRSKNRMPQR